MGRKKGILDLTKSISQIGKEIERERKRKEKILKALPSESPWRKLGWNK
jgi:hypothetical protein